MSRKHHKAETACTGFRMVRILKLLPNHFPFCFHFDCFIQIGFCHPVIHHGYSIAQYFSA